MQGRTLLLGLLSWAACLAAQAAGQPPVAQTPAALYHNYCSVCHGDRGDGRSRAASSLVPPPRSFVTPESLQTLTRERMIEAVRDGRPGTAMTSWHRQLDEAQIESVVDYVREAFMNPAASPAMRRGPGLYQVNCAACHGAHGDGTGPAATGLGTRPRDFRTPQAAETLNRDRMLAAVTYGRPGTAMPSFAGRLSDKDIQLVVDYVRTAFMMPAPVGISGVHARGRPASTAGALPGGLMGDVAKGRAFYRANCFTCHGLAGDGKGPRAYFIRPVPRDFTSADSRASFDRRALYEAISQGRLGTEMPAWSKVLAPQQIADVAEYVYRAFIRPEKGR